MTPDIPLQNFPDWVGEYVREVSRKLEVDTSAIATLALGALSHACMGRYDAEIRPGWVEPVTLYVGYVAKPGERKSGAHKDIWGPLRSHERKQAERIESQRRAAIGERQALEKAAKTALSDRASAETEEDKTAARERHKQALTTLDSIEVPPLPVPILDDTTSEALAVCMKDSLGCATIASAEGHGFFLRAAGMYSKGEASQDIYLKGHASEPVRVTRIGREALYLPQTLITICLTMQPAVLQSLGDKDMRGTGFLARFLLCIPPSLVGKRKNDGPDIAPLVRRSYAHRIMSLADVEVSAERRVIKFSDGANDMIFRFMCELEPRLAGDLQPIVDWASKLAGAAARIATMFHVADQATEAEPWANDVSSACALRGIEVARAFIPHALAAFGHIAGGQHRAVREDFEARLRGRFAVADRFTKRDVMRAFRELSAKETDALLDHLTESGALEEGKRKGKTRQFRFQDLGTAGQADNAEAAQ